MPNEYNREVFGGEMSDACEFHLEMRRLGYICGRSVKRLYHSCPQVLIKCK